MAVADECPLWLWTHTQPLFLMSVYTVMNHTPKWFFEILSASSWIIVFPTRFKKGYIFTRAMLRRRSRILRRRCWRRIAWQRDGRQILVRSKTDRRWCVVVVLPRTAMDPHSLASVIRVIGGEYDGSHRLGHHQTMSPPHESYGLFDARISGIFGSTLRLHVGNGMVALRSGLDALFENKRKVT